MLAFSPLASAPLGADASIALPQVLGQTSGLLAFGGTAAAQTQIGAQSAGLPARLSLGGDARAKAALSGWSALELRLGIDADVRSTTEAGAGLVLVVAGAASVGNTPAARLAAELPLVADGRAEAQITGHATAVLDLSAAVQSAARIDGRANTLLDLQRSSEADSQIDVTATRSLPLAGSASAVLAGEGTSTGAVSVAITARVGVAVVQRAASPIALGGTARVAGVPSGAAGGEMALDGLGAVANRASAAIMAGLEITSHARARAPALGQSAALVPCAGLGFAVVISEGNGEISLAMGLDAEATTALSALAGGGVPLSGQSRLGVTISASGRPIQLVLGGSAVGTSLEPREARVSGALTLTGKGHAIGALGAKGDATVVFANASASICTIRAALSGQLSLDRALEAALLVGGEAQRAMAFAGAARATAQTSAGAQDPLLAVAGEARARSDAIATGGADLALMGEAAASGAVTAAGHADLDAEILISATVGAQGTLAPALDLRGTALCEAPHRLRAEGPLAWQALASGETAAFGTALAGQTLTGGTVGAMAIRGAASSAFAVTRAAAGDVDVQGDSTRQIELSGIAATQTATTGGALDADVALNGTGIIEALAGARSAASVTFRFEAQAELSTVATTATTLGWSVAAAATAPRSAQCAGAMSLAGAALARPAAMGTAAAAAFPIAGSLSGAVATIADLRSDAALDGAAGARIDAAARAAGQILVARSSAADVQIGVDAGRTLPLPGAAIGSALVQVARCAGSVSFTTEAQAQALTQAGTADGSVFTAQGQVTGRASLHATSQGDVSVTRLGRGGLLVTGIAARAMVFIGAARAHAITQAAANLPVAPGFAGAGTTTIELAFHGQAVITGRGSALSPVRAAASGSDWDLAATAIAYRAPPALGRSEPPRFGISGRLMPTNTGRILRG